MGNPYRDPAPTRPDRNGKKSSEEKKQPNPAAIVDALNGVFGKQNQARAIHAKGIVLLGTFRPAPTAAALSKALHLQNSMVPVTVRFSNFAGIPTIPDVDPMASPRGLAVKFHLPDGSHTDIVAHSVNAFPTSTAEDFRQLFVALRGSGPDAQSPTTLERFFASHPRAQAFFETPKPPPVSYGTLPYFGINSFRFTNSRGDVTYGRYQLTPTAGDQRLSREQLATAQPNYLSEEIRARVARGPVSFTLKVQVAGPGDIIDDPSTAWPDSRETVVLGTIDVTRSVANSEVAERALIFSPALLPDGIEPADPMILVRHDAYGVSYARRHE